MNPLISLPFAILLASAAARAPLDGPPGNHAFAADLFAALRGEGDQNLAFSPLSVRMTLAMTRLGAAGTTDAEIARVAHFDDDANHTAELYAKLLEQMESQNVARVPRGDEPAPAYLMHLANAIWTAQGLPLRDDYVDAVRSLLRADAAPLDFADAPDESRRVINAWIADHTAGRIRELLAPGALTPDTRAVLTNALHFAAAWHQPFSTRATETRTFHGAGGDLEAPFMRTTEWLGYFADDEAQAVSLGFRDNRAAMTLVVPRGGLDTLEAGLSGSRLAELLRGVREHGAKIELSVPRFEIESKVELTEALRALGLEETLSERADFGRMSSEPLFVDRAVHQARVRIDEHGAEASAATAFLMKAGAAATEPVIVTVDRPFVFVIHERATGAILFLGRVARL